MSAKIRVVCPHCRKPINLPQGVTQCPKCQQEILLPQNACFYLYRQGSPYGIAGGFGVYINGMEMGRIGNRELLCFPVPYGTYNIHCAVGMSRKCKDMQVTLTPENPVAYAKVYIKPGFWTNSFVVQPVDPNLLEF